MANTKVDVEIQIGNGPAIKSMGDLKKQLKEANFEALALSEKFGASSKEAIEAAKRVAQLKDAIGDAKTLTEGFNPDKKFTAFAGAIQGVVGGLSALQGAQALFGSQSEELEKTLVKVQGALALTQGLDALKDAGQQFKVIKAVAIDAFQGIKTAIGSTGIGLLVIALGTIYAYWDDIKGAVTGVNAETIKLNEEAKKQKELTGEALKNIERQENTYKLQGLTQKEILKLKIQALDKDIQSQIAVIQTFEKTKQEQVEAAKRNKDYLISILNFFEAPVRFIYDNLFAGINKVLTIVNKVAGTKIEPISTDFFDKANEFLSKKLFDPEQVKKDNAETSKANNELLEDLKNQRSGFVIAIKDIDKQEVKSAKENQKEIRDAKNKTYLDSITDAKKLKLETLRISNETAIEDIKNSERSTKQKNALIAELTKQYGLEKTKLEQEIADDEFDIAQKKNEKIAEEGNKRRKREFENAQKLLSDESSLELKNANDKELTLNQRVEALNNREALGTKIVFDNQAQRTAFEKENAEARKQIAKDEAEYKQAQLSNIANALGALSEIVGKETAVGKGLAVAQATISTYQNAVSAYSSAFKPIATAASPILGSIYAGIAVAQGIANVKKILAVKVPNGGGGGAVPTAVPSIAAPAPLTPQVSGTALQQAQINQLSSATTRAFVLESDVSGNQERIQRLNRAARIN